MAKSVRHDRYVTVEHAAIKCRDPVQKALATLPSETMTNGKRFA